MLSPIDPIALELTAGRAGLTPEQVLAAIVQFRAVNEMADEPKWGPSISHMTMRDCAQSLWQADGTMVGMQMTTPRYADGRFGIGVKSYVFNGEAYETFAEARFAEITLSTTTTKDDQ
jgi:hypothetical protein